MSDNVFKSLVRINRMRIQNLKQELKAYNYVGVMHLIIFYLRRHPGASQEEIADYYLLDKTSVARDARRLEEMRHISREIAPNNRRQYRLYMTLEGEVFAKILDQIQEKFSSRLSDGLSREEWETLASLLKRVEESCCEK